MSLTIALDGVSKAYADIVVFRECSFTFQVGLTYALLGVNGAGKSTLLRMLALLENPDTGSVSYLENDRPLQPDLALKRRLTLVLPQVGVFNTTVFQNVAYGLKIRGLDKRESQVRVQRLLEMVGLAEKQSHPAATLSSGQAKRLGLARALAIEPEALFLDEPTASIDWANTEVIEAAIATLREQRKTTIVLATHDYSQARRLADEILVLEAGKIGAWSERAVHGWLPGSKNLAGGE